MFHDKTNSLYRAVANLLLACLLHTAMALKLPRVVEFFVPRLFEEKRRDIVFGFPSFRPSFRPPIGVCTLWAQLLLQFYSDSFETLQMS